MSGHVGDLSDKQESALAKMRSNLQDVWDELPEKDDYFFLRWLCARKFDVKKAETMLRDHLVTRKKWDFDHILEWEPPEVLQKYFTGRMYGFTRDGNPIFYERIGKNDFRGLVRSAKKEDLIRCRLRNGNYMLKLLKEQSEKLGRRVGTVTCIYDLEDISLQKHFYMPGIKIITEVVRNFELNFPEILNAVYVVNVPSIFDLCYSIIKPFLDEITLHKIHKLSGSVDQFGPQLLEVVEPSQLPACYGGSLVGPGDDQYCNAMLCGGGIIPEKYYITLPANDNVRNVAVSPHSTQQIEVAVDKAGSTLRWNFATDSYDIAFGVFYKSKENADIKLHAKEMEELVPTGRVNSHLLPQEGSLMCGKAGIYVLRFSNTFSMVRSKAVHFFVDVDDPDADCEASATLT